MDKRINFAKLTAKDEPILSLYVNLTNNNDEKVIWKILKVEFFERLVFFDRKGRLLRQILKNTEGEIPPTIK